MKLWVVVGCELFYWVAELGEVGTANKFAKSIDKKSALDYHLTS